MSGSNISGTPTTAGTSAVTVTVTDSAGNTASQVFSLVVSAAVTNPTLAAISTQSITTGVSYSLTLSATGGTSPYTFSSSALPAGLSLSGAVVSGTPTAAATTSVTFTVTDSLGNKGTEVVSFVVSASVSPVTISAFAAQSLTVGTSYSLALASHISGGTTPYTITSTTLPAGLILSAEVISGTPTTTGTTSVTVTVTDSSTPTHLTGTAVISMVVSAAVVTSSVPAVPALPSDMTRVFLETFESTAALGSFASAYPNLADLSYSGDNPDSNDGTNVYSTSSVLYVAESTGGGGNSMYYKMFVSGGISYTAAPCPSDGDDYAAFTYGSWGCCAKLVASGTNTDGTNAFGMHWLMWPTSGAWTNEVDWPDGPGVGPFSGPLGANSLLTDDMGNFSSSGKNSAVNITDGNYHTFEVNWPSASEMQCYADGVLVTTFTNANGNDVPSQQMRISLQCEADYNETSASDAVALLEVPWVYINQLN
jgi:hypothetical protein